jgi:hypothetical protein
MRTEGIVALDIETKNLDMKTEGLKFGQPEGWKTSCVALYEVPFGSEIESGNSYYYAHVDELPYVQAQLDAQGIDIKVNSFSALTFDLARMWEEGYLLITKNGLGFDLPILSKPVELGGADAEGVITTFEEEGRHLDLERVLYDRSGGYRFSLAALVKSLVPDDEKLMQASFAPVEWNAGNYSEVLEYCLHDSYLTAKVYVGAQDKSFWAYGKKDDIKVNFLLQSPW